MAHPHSGMKESNILLSSASSDGSNFPYFLIFAKRPAWVPLMCVKNFDSNLEISDVTILSKYPLTPAKITQTCSSATIGTYFIIIIYELFLFQKFGKLGTSVKKLLGCSVKI